MITIITLTALAVAAAGTMGFFVGIIIERERMTAIIISDINNTNLRQR